MLVSGQIIAMLLMMASGDDPMDDARKTYSNCIIEIMNTNLDSKASEKAFKSAAKDGCQDERKAYISLISKDELTYGSSKKEAEEYAIGEADDIIAGFVDGYGIYASSGTRPVQQK